MMARTNKQTRANEYAQLVERQQGEYCVICKITPVTLIQLGKSPMLIIDHINGDLTDTRLENKRLLCFGCNIKEGHRIQREFLESDIQLYEVARSMDTQAKIYLMNRIANEKAIERKGITADIASYLNCSMAWSRNFLQKVTAINEGLYRWEDRYGTIFLAIKPELKV